jgi:hypothetical protein
MQIRAVLKLICTHHSDSRSLSNVWNYHNLSIDFLSSQLKSQNSQLKKETWPPSRHLVLEQKDFFFLWNKLLQRSIGWPQIHNLPTSAFKGWLLWERESKRRKLRRWIWLMSFLYKNEYKLFKPVDITIRRGPRQKEEK